MAIKRKRTSLDALISPVNTNVAQRTQAVVVPARKSRKPKAEKKLAAVESEVVEVLTSKDEIIRQTLYLPLPVFDQLRDLFFEEQRGRVKRRRMHDYFLEGINLLFKDRGLKSIEELTGKK
jgi:hypothetical protein